MSGANPARRLGTLLGGGATEAGAGGPRSFHFVQLDLDAVDPTPVMASLSFLAHGVTADPLDRDRVLLFEKWGPGCCALRLSTRQVEATITTAPNRQFYGHGAFSPDGSLLYCTETDLEDSMRGYIAVRDGRTYASLGDFPTHGLAPHDCLLRDDGRTLIITNGGSKVGAPLPPSVTHVDVRSGKLLGSEPIPQPEINAGHLAMTETGGLAVVSAPREGAAENLGGICVRGPGAALRPVQAPPDVAALFVGETLSVAIHEPSGTVATTQPLGNLIAFWGLERGELRRSMRVPNPRGVALSLDGRDFVVTFGGTAKVARVDASTLSVVADPGNRDGILCGATGSHVTMYDLPVAGAPS